MSGSLVAEIDALIAKVKACPIKTTVVASSKTSQSAPPKKQEEEKEQSATQTTSSGGGGGAGRLNCETVKEGQLVEVVAKTKELRKLWTEAELGGIDDSDLEGYFGHVGKVMEIEDDDDTVQVQWENLDAIWIPVAALTNTSKVISSPAPVSHLPPGFEREMAEAAAKAAVKPQPGLTQVDGDYLDIDKVEDGMHVQVTEDITRFRTEWEKAELGIVEDITLALYLLQTGKITEVEDDDDSVQIRWENYDTAWVPANCVRDASGTELTSPPAVSCLDRDPNAARTQQELDETPQKRVFMRRDYSMSGELYLTFEADKENTVKAKQTYMVTLDQGYMGMCAEDADMEVDAATVCGYNGRVTKIDGKFVEFTFNDKKKVNIPINALHKSNKKKKKKGSPKWA